MRPTPRTVGNFCDPQQRARPPGEAQQHVTLDGRKVRALDASVWVAVGRRAGTGIGRPPQHEDPLLRR